MLNVASTQELENAAAATVTTPAEEVVVAASQPKEEVVDAAPQPKEEVVDAASQPKEEVVDAASQPKEEMVDAAPQHKDEVDATKDDNSPEICLSHLPATEEVGSQHAPLQVLAAKSLAVEAPAQISCKYSNAVQAQFKQSGPFIDSNWILLDSRSSVHLFTNGKLFFSSRTSTLSQIPPELL